MHNPEPIPKKRGQDEMGLRLVLVVVILLLAFSALWLWIGLRLATQARTALSSSLAVRSEMVAKLADMAGEMVWISNRVQSATEENLKVSGIVQQQGDLRDKKETVLKADLQHFSTWIETENTRLSRALIEAQTRSDELQRQVLRQNQEMIRLQEEWSRQQSQLKEALAGSAQKSTGTAAAVSAEGARDISPAANLAGPAMAGPTPAVISITMPSGDVYRGGIVNGLFEGQGELIYANGNRYTGQFLKGQKQGKGTFVFSNGDTYSGDFFQDMRHGKGAYVYRDGSRYEGEFQSGLRNGKGRYIYRGGGEYTGDFKDGKKNGFGTHVFADGTKLEGYWREDRYIGPAGASIEK